jgi:hypothetical protein
MYLQTRYYNGSVWAYRDNLVLASSGNVGIGTSSPGELLDLRRDANAGSVIKVRNANGGTADFAGLFLGNDSVPNGGGIIIFGSKSTYSSPYNPNGTYIYSNMPGGISITSETTAPVYIATNNSIRLYVTSAGNVGIGTTDPGDDKLQINEPSNENLNVGIVARGGNSKRAQLTFGVKSSSSANVGGSIGSSGTRGGGLVLQGNTGSVSEGAAHLFISAGGDISAGTLTGSSNRQLYVTSAGVLTTSSSDARLKTNIEVIPNALQKVMGLRGVTYNWKDGRDTTRVLGMIAQEMLKVAPELVFQNNNGYYGIHYAETTGLLVEAIKEQQKVIEQLKAEQTTTSSLLRQLQLDLQTIRKQNTVLKE